MPHVIVKLWPGKSEEQKTQLAEEITRSVMRTLNFGEDSVSVAFEEIAAKRLELLGRFSIQDDLLGAQSVLHGIHSRRRFPRRRARA